MSPSWTVAVTCVASYAAIEEDTFSGVMVGSKTGPDVILNLSNESGEKAKSFITNP